MQPSPQHAPPHPAPEQPSQSTGREGGVRLSPHPLPCTQARQICFLLHDHPHSHLAIKDALVTLCSHTLLWPAGKDSPGCLFQLQEAAGCLHPQHRSSMGSLHPGLLAECSSRQLAAGSLSHSTASFCTEKDRVQTLLQPRKVFLPPTMRPGGHSCMGCDPASNHTSPCKHGSRVLAPQVPPQPRALMDGLQPLCSHHAMHTPGVLCTSGKSSSALGMNCIQTTLNPSKTSSSARCQPCRARHQAGSSMDTSLNSQHGPAGAQFQAGSGVPDALSNTCTHEGKRIKCGPSVDKHPAPGLCGG